MTFKQVIKQVVTGAVTLGTALGGSGLFLELISSPIDHDFVPMLLTMGGLFGASFLGGKYFLKLRKENKLLAESNSNEGLAKEILGLAVLNDGKINVTQAVFELNIPIETAKKSLEYLYEQGVLQAQVGDKGGFSYYMVDFVETNQIETNQNFLD
jgi:predicted transcriptional regulator